MPTFDVIVTRTVTAYQRITVSAEDSVAAGSKAEDKLRDPGNWLQPDGSHREGVVTEVDVLAVDAIAKGVSDA